MGEMLVDELAGRCHSARNCQYPAGTVFPGNGTRGGRNMAHVDRGAARRDKVAMIYKKIVPWAPPLTWLRSTRGSFFE
jgi:hypothetical protein